jgi:hypothetical protein
VENVCRWPSRQGRLRRLVGDVAIPESSRARGLYAKLPTATLGNERARLGARVRPACRRPRSA